MTLRRLAVLQWAGFLLGGIAWFAYHIAGWGLTEVECNSAGLSINHDLWQALLVAAAATLVAGAGAAAVAILIETRGTSYEADPPSGRLRFVALAAVVANVLFLVIILLDGIGSIFNVACRQA